MAILASDIVEYLKTNQLSTVEKIANDMGASTQIIYTRIRKLKKAGIVVKVGKEYAISKNN